MSEIPNPRSLRPIVWVAVPLFLTFALGFMLQFYHTGATDLATEPAAEVAVAARDMLAGGGWVHASEGLAPERPPLYAWCVRLIAQLDGEVGVRATRLPGGICAILMMFLAGAWSWNHCTTYPRDDDASAPPIAFAFMAAMMLGLCPALILAGRAGSPLTMGALFFLAGAFCWGESLEARRSYYAGFAWRYWIFWGYIFGGLAMLAAGPAPFYILLAAYIFAARVYRIRGFDWIHLAGLAIALYIGGFWLFLNGVDPALKPATWIQWLLLERSYANGGPASLGGMLAEWITHLFPWNMLALLMAWRVWSKTERSPTRVFWMSALLAGTLLPLVFGFRVGFTPVYAAPLVALMAADGIFRWHFESRPWSPIFKYGMRLILLALIVLGIFFSLLLQSILALILFILSSVVWIVWLVQSRQHGPMFTPWEGAVRVTAVALLLMLTVTTLVLADWEIRREYHDRVIQQFTALRQRMQPGAQVWFWAPADDFKIPALYRYYLGERAELRATGDLKQLLTASDHAWLIGPASLPLGAVPGQRLTMIDRLEDGSMLFGAGTASHPPLRLALLGNAGTRTSDQVEVGRALDRRRGDLILDDAVLLGNNIYGSSVFDHLNFLDAFIRPYRRLLRDGARFHAVAGHEDRDYNWALRHYTPYNMNGRLYGKATLRPGLLELFKLDSNTLILDNAAAEKQWAWLDSELAASAARWRIVVLHHAPVSQAANGREHPILLERLLPIAQRHNVQLIAWAGEQWYERTGGDAATPLMIQSGWSGGHESARVSPGKLSGMIYSHDSGFVWLEVTPERLVFEALTANREVIDRGVLNPAGDLVADLAETGAR